MSVPRFTRKNITIRSKFGYLVIPYHVRDPSSGEKYCNFARKDGLEIRAEIEVRLTMTDFW